MTLSIRELDGYSDSDLFAELGELLGETSVGFADDDPAQHEPRGRRWFEENLQRIRAAVCGNTLTKKFAGADTDDRDQQDAMIAAAATTLQDVTGSSGSALVLAVIVSRMGLRRLCNDAPPS